MQSDTPRSFPRMLLALLLMLHAALVCAQGQSARFSNWEFTPPQMMQKVEQTADKLVFKLDKSVPGPGGTMTLRAGEPLKGTLASRLDAEWKQATKGRKLLKAEPDDQTELMDGTKGLRRSAMTTNGGFFSVTAFAAPNGVNFMLMDAADEMATQILAGMTFGFSLTLKLHPVGAATTLAQSATGKATAPPPEQPAQLTTNTAQKPMSGATKAPFISHRDLATIPTLHEDIDCPKTRAAPLDANARHPVEGLIGGAKLNYAQTMANLQALLEATATSKAIEALRKSPEVRDPAAAESVVSGALYKKQPSAALGLLLVAHQNSPKDPLLLVNLAGLANYLSLHREALSLLDEAAKLKPANVRVGGMSLQAVMLSNKGYALNATGRPKEAEAALQEAIRLDPNLAEAYTNIAYALGDQNNCRLAARYLHAGNTRRPATVMAAKKPLERIPPAEVIDLSRGRTGQLPAMHLAANPEEGANETLKKRLGQIGDQAHKQLDVAMERQGKFTRQAQLKRAAWYDRGGVGVVSAERAEWLLVLAREYAEDISIVIELAGIPGQKGKRYSRVLMEGAVPQEPVDHGDPELVPKIEAVNRARLEMLVDRFDALERFTEQRGRAYRAYDDESRKCAQLRDDRLCKAGAELRRDTAICSAGKEAASMRMGSMTAFNAAFRDLYGEAFRRLNAVATYFADAAHHGEMQARINFFAARSTLSLLGQVAAHNELQSSGAKECRASNKRMVDLVTDYLKMLEAEKCNPGSSSGKIGVGVVEVGANCEEVSATVSTPGWLGLFVKVGYEQSMRYEYVKAGKERFLAQQAGLDGTIRPNLGEYGAAFDGKLTIYAGGFAKAEGAGLGADVKSGGYIEVNGKGDITGYGKQTEASISGTAKGVGAETTVYKERTVFSPSRSQN